MSVVLKFGGTSVADADAISRLVGIVRRQAAKTPSVVVVSALAGVTDALVAVARFAEAGDAGQAAKKLDELAVRHEQVAKGVTNVSQQGLLGELANQFSELRALVDSHASRHEMTPESNDAILAAGEIVSSRLVAAALVDHALPSVWVDSRQALITSADHSSAIPDMRKTAERVRDRVACALEAGKVVVLGGFVGSTVDGVTTTLGRGGSDYSAAVFGACLDADEIQIWTDVDGMLTADPRVVSDPRVVPRLTFAEASELAYFGAKVLHPSTILPAVGKNIPVRILNARRPDNAGTLIDAGAQSSDAPLTAIACKREVTVIDITSTRMLMAHGFLMRLFEVFERFKTAVDVVTTSEVSVSVTVDDTRRLDAIVESLETFAEVACEPKMAIICAVGENLRTNPDVFARAVKALDGIPLRLVSQAGSRRNVTFVMPDGDVPRAMMSLHETFF
ncbi:MAG TPA: aspartate kinase [Vicinamibacterales bacterium]|nr:aspartate kinase [Vicinamibacterales bacterium]